MVYVCDTANHATDTRTAFATTTTTPFHIVGPLLLFLCAAAVCCRIAVVGCGIEAFHHPTVVHTKESKRRRFFLHSSSTTASFTLSRLNDLEKQRSFFVNRSTISLMMISPKESKSSPGAAVAAEADNTSSPSEAFLFCHSDIARILKGPMEEQKKHSVDRSTAMDVLLLQKALSAFDDGEGVDAATVDDLIDLATTCDEGLFSGDGNSTFLSACWRNNESSSSSSSQQDLQHQFLLSLVQEVRVAEAEEREGPSKPQRADNSYVTVATLLALNVLETTIEQLTSSLPSKVRKKNRSSGGSSGAPLLRNMLRELEQVKTVPSYLAKICFLLLLPNDNGLNFRNLIWHGFVAAVPRPWFSLVVILIYELQKVMVLRSNGKDQDGVEQLTNEHLGSSTSVMDLRAYPEVERILTDSGSTMDDAIFHRIVSWVEHTTGSPEHTALCRLGLKWMCPVNGASETRGRPATICAVLSVVLEHCLRLEWCRANDRPDDVIARPGALYVTLDGHGQRHVHDLILHPYLLNATEENGEEVSGLPRRPNKLLWGGHQDLNGSGRPYKLDASTVNLLMDLFCSPFGPNMRAAAAHGQWNVRFTEEWLHTTERRSDDTCQQRLWDMTHMLCYGMDRLSSESMDAVQSTSPLQRNPYHPVFTYAQSIRRGMARARQTWSKLKAIDARYPQVESAVSPTCLLIQSHFSSFDPFHVEDLLLSKTLREFSVLSLVEEYELNCQLAVHGRTRNLLEEVANALEVYAERLFAANAFLGSEETQYNTSWKRKQKTATRLVAANKSILSFYKFSYWVALSALQSSIVDTFETRSDGLTASPELVRRTSMTLSTIDTFVGTNLDRAIQAILEFSSSRALKELLRSRKEIEAKFKIDRD